MGRQIRRVPLDFDHPVGEVWPGFLSPDSLHEEPCEACDGTGYSPEAKRLQDRWYGNVHFEPYETGSTPFTADTPEVWAFAERNVARSPDYYGRGEYAIVREAERLAGHFNNGWLHHLAQEDVDALIADGRLYDFTHTWKKGDGWQPKDPAPVVTAEQVNRWSLSGMGHDSINCWVVVKAACARQGVPYTCTVCDGNGGHEKYPGQRAEAEAWEPSDPPEGDGWQLWETVSEGSPISPVFDSAEALAAWLADPDRPKMRPTDEAPRDWMPYEAALKFVLDGWTPTLIATPETGVVSGAEFIGWHSQENTR